MAAKMTCLTGPPNAFLVETLRATPTGVVKNGVPNAILQP